jgi:hypothetical protein
VALRAPKVPSDPVRSLLPGGHDAT